MVPLVQSPQATENQDAEIGRNKDVRQQKEVLIVELFKHRQKKLRVFAKDDKLDKIRTNVTLNHEIQKVNVGSSNDKLRYVDMCSGTKPMLDLNCCHRDKRHTPNYIIMCNI